MKKFFFFTILVILFTACSKKQQTQQSNHEHQENHNHNKQNDADKEMHQVKIEKLIKMFESPERDAYQKPEKVMDFLGDIKGKKIMDIGAGTGYFTVRMAKKGAHVIAADVDDQFQEYLKKRIIKEGLTENVKIRKIPFDNPSLKTAEVDMVFLVNTYHHIENRVEYFKKVKQGLKKGGELVVIDFYKTELPVGPPVHHKLAMDKAIVELKQVGFNSIKVNVELLDYQYIVRAR